MKTTTLTFPELFLIAGTRNPWRWPGSLLIAKRLTDEQRETAALF
jgi:hypothetical protein